MEDKREGYDSEQILTKIEELCRERDWSKYRLAKESGIKHSTLTTIFTKRSTISLLNLARICKAFEMTVSQFFMLLEKEESMELTSDLPVELWKKLSGKERRLFTAMLETAIAIDENKS